MKYALITGASRGIGAEFAKLFARDGVGVILCSSPRGWDELQVQVLELKSVFGVEAYALCQDLSLPGAAAALIEQVNELGLPIEYLVNNAGVGIVGIEFQGYDQAQMTAMLQLNVVTLSELTLHYVKQMLPRGRGRILNVSAASGYIIPHGLETGYAASKSYVISLSEALSCDLRGTGVTCTHVAPSATKTGFFFNAGLVDDRRLAKLGYSQPEEVARAGYQAMQAGHMSVVPGLSNKIIIWLARISPSRLLTGIISSYVVTRKLD
ncbi:short-chain dehydrogenase/reductase SDR [Pseudomonas sp. R1-43-08]|uniref:SDR family NAD(P)-dependent oxidoreductase n=1 Tax=Pseudomonas sp. R1-43-08 TaxID=1173270 RepID=UPI000F5846E7|nr:SDR family NAD(P)-dependent oxidoreductase [Pseudomonas sp. R1-43-08]AZF43374.1 short-chain dehydrogenase/reductase SDR [Pseudomonas sp. R1-43-08]